MELSPSFPSIRYPVIVFPSTRLRLVSRLAVIKSTNMVAVRNFEVRTTLASQNLKFGNVLW